MLAARFSGITCITCSAAVVSCLSRREISGQFVTGSLVVLQRYNIRRIGLKRREYSVKSEAMQRRWRDGVNAHDCAPYGVVEL